MGRGQRGAKRIAAFFLSMILGTLALFHSYVQGADWTDLGLGPALGILRKGFPTPREFSLPPFPETLREAGEHFHLGIPSYLKTLLKSGIRLSSPQGNALQKAKDGTCFWGADPEKNVGVVFPAVILPPICKGAATRPERASPSMAISGTLPSVGDRPERALPSGRFRARAPSRDVKPEHEIGGQRKGIGALGRLTVLNANLWLLPEPVPIRQHDRMRAFLDLLGDCPPDVLVLQEVWLLSYANFLREHLPGYWCVFPRYDLYNQTGLVIFSRYQPQSAQYGHFGRSFEHNIEEQFANKGFLKIQVVLPGIIVNILDTHLYAPRGRVVERAITDRQLLSLRVLGNGASETLIVCGDLNTGSEDVKTVLGGTFILENDLTTSTQPKKNGRKIDFVMIKPAENVVGIIDSHVVKEPFVSDHLPVVATLSFTNKP